MFPPFPFLSFHPPPLPPPPPILLGMDARIWSRLPQRLVDQELSPSYRLPPFFLSPVRMQEMVFSLVLSHLPPNVLQINPKPYFFIFFPNKNHKPKTTTTNTTSTVFKHGNTPAATVPEEGYIFDPETLSWHRLVFPLIPSGFSPTCSSGGLVCWVSDEAGSKGLLLSNPLFSIFGHPTPVHPEA
ncbi:hypothetical protein Hdeb2414_s0016g00491561 [Helianthus debilis subsp. tardiflorus]